MLLREVRETRVINRDPEQMLACECEAEALARDAAGQVIGLVFAVVSLVRLARDRGVLDASDIDSALQGAEAELLGFDSDRRLKSAALPIRTLRAMITQWPCGGAPDDNSLDAFLAGRSDTI